MGALIFLLLLTVYLVIGVGVIVYECLKNNLSAEPMADFEKKMPAWLFKAYWFTMLSVLWPFAVYKFYIEDSSKKRKAGEISNKISVLFAVFALAASFTDNYIVWGTCLIISALYFCTNQIVLAIHSRKEN